MIFVKQNHLYFASADRMTSKHNSRETWRRCGEEATWFSPNLIVIAKSAENGLFFQFSDIFCKTNPQNVLNNIWFLWYEKIFTKIFWSHGTPLGYLGAGSQEALGLGACRFQILVIWGQYDFPVLVACQGQAKNLKTAGTRCVIGGRIFHLVNICL